ncbi:MAG TPA: ABC transporter substrate-binding protein [Dehalococcoidia bacterium]|nr:ABC transporter substrate-binding protein [Dehalococcoidia bacterium]
MAKKILWLFISCVMVLSFVISSCDTETEKEKIVEDEGPAEVKIIETSSGTGAMEKIVEEKGLRDPDEPKYGGTYNFIAFGDYRGWDPVINLTMDCTAQHYVGGYPMMGDWKKGPAGTNEIEWVGGFAGRGDVWTGNLAESWEIVGGNKIIFHVRQGVHFHDKYPVNGREMDAYDFEYSMNRTWYDKRAYHQYSVDRDAIPTAIYAEDKWACVMEVPPKQIGVIWLLTGAMSWIYPHEVIDVYGDMLDWQNLVGAGPFILTDYVTASMIKYKRNPNYWQNDPFNPENQLPYVDGLKSLIIADASTRLAAFRTGQVDRMGGMTWEDGELLKKQCPDLLYITGYGGINFPCMIVNNPDLPYYDIKVRQAMNLAVNQQEILDDYYSGHATILGWPYLPTPAYSPWYVPLDEQSGVVQELFSYDTTRAKQLLADAGYPNGFKCDIQCVQANADFLSIIKEYLAVVGIDMNIEPLESGGFYSITRARKHEDMIYKFWTNHWPARMLDSRMESFDNHAFFETTQTRAWYNDIMGHYFDPDYINPLLKQYGSYILEQAIGIWLPVPYAYHMWWPWLQNYHGEGNMGFVQPEFFIYYSWLDTEMRTEMGY